MRTLVEDDIPGAMRLKEAAHWNQTGEDWRNVLRLSPAGCFGIDCEGRLAATATNVCYGDRLAWIGMVLTHPDFRGRGLARRLMERSLEWLEARPVEWIKLDATDMGRPLYAKLGFQDECAIERWARPPGGAVPPLHLPAAQLETWASLDRSAFGADRAGLLRVLAAGETAEVAGGGYGMGRPGANAAYFGPCVARSADAARALVQWFVARHADATVYWDILPGNAGAVAIACDFGFSPLRRLVRMARPGRPRPREFVHSARQVFAIAGFEFG